MDPKITREYGYDDVYLRPRKCIVDSRSECDISVKLGGRIFRNPVIAANMKSVVNYDTCKYFASKDMFYIMHRFDLNNNEHLSFIEEMNKTSFSSISVGISQTDEDFINFLCDNNTTPTYITIDVAHAHSDRVADMISFIRRSMNPFIIAGNVATGEAVQFLQESGADAIKILVAPGAACTTKSKTGFTRGTINCILECSEVARVPLISDGGIREPGHIAKAMACGATMVMVGSYLCGFDQSPGEIVNIDGKKKYIYYGSASFNNKGNKKHIEGTELILDYKGNMDDCIYDIECSLKSAVSYSGKRNILDMYGTSIFSIR